MRQLIHYKSWLPELFWRTILTRRQICRLVPGLLVDELTRIRDRYSLTALIRFWSDLLTTDCNLAVIFAGCQTSTLLSLIPAVISTVG